jgi:DNA polymerase III subunit gamma/tau
LLARAADGSARDGLSLLDRALAHVEGAVGEADTRGLLGLADRTQVFDLFDSIMKGATAQALTQLGEAYRAGADPAIVVQDLLDVTHWLTRLKVAPDLANDPTVPEAERARGKTLAAGLPMAVLARAWQMLLKGLTEIQTASSPLAAAEMLLVRLAYAAELPTPAELVAGVAAAPVQAPGKPAPLAGNAPLPSNGGAPARTSASSSAVSATSLRGTPGGGQVQALRSDAVPAAEASPQPAADRPDPQSFLDVVALFEAKREALIHAHLVSHVHLVRFEAGRIEYNPEPQAPRNLPARMMELLQGWTGRRWVVVINATADGAPTLTQQAHRAREAQKEAAAAHPLVDEVLKAFPGATIEAVRGMTAPGPDTDTPSTDDESGLEADDAEESS